MADTTTWQASTGPDFLTEVRRILDLHDPHRPTVGVVRVDEFGRSTCRPRNGRPWRSLRPPRRLRATYTRPAGAIDMLAALDLATGRMHVIAEAVGRLVWASPGP